MHRRNACLTKISEPVYEQNVGFVFNVIATRDN